MASMFDELLDSGGAKGRKRGKVLPVSIGVHALALVAVLVLPLYMEDLPEPVEDQVVRAFFVEAAPPPPPPPPPPPAAAAAPRPQPVKVPPKIEKPKIEPVKVPETPKFVAPVEKPVEAPVQDLGPTTQMASSDIGLPGGVVGGVAEGVPEGVVGGQVGGEVGGVEGGEVGGVKGGTVGGEVGGVVGGVGDAPAPPAPTGPVRVGGQIKPPAKVRNVAPDYPAIAREARISGVVVLEATIGRDGGVDQVRVLRGVPMLNDAAVAAVRKWTYTPTLLNGVAVPVIMTVTVNFELD